MRKILFSVLLTLGVLSGSAYNDDYDIIDLNDNFINNSTAIMKEVAVEIFNKEYVVYVQNINLNHNWFMADILIKKAWDVLNYDVEQYCEYEDKTPDVHGNMSSIEVAMYQNYDFMISSIVHLKKHEYGQMEVVYTIHDIANWNNTFDLVLRFPYEDTTVTAIETIGGDKQPIEYFDIQGRKLNGPQPGIVIEKQGNKTTKKIYK